MEDLHRAGGIPALMNELTKKNLISRDCMTVTGMSVGDNIASAAVRDNSVIMPIDKPYRKPRRTGHPEG